MGREEANRMDYSQCSGECLPGIPAIGFGIKFVGGDELNLSLSKISKSSLLRALNVQLEGKAKQPVNGIHPKPNNMVDPTARY